MVYDVRVDPCVERWDEMPCERYVEMYGDVT